MNRLIWLGGLALAIALSVAAVEVPVSASSVSNSTVQVQAADAVGDWNGAVIDAHDGYPVEAKMLFQAGLVFVNDLATESSNTLAREYYSGLFNPLEPLVLAWILGYQVCPVSLYAGVNSSEAALIAGL
jgi:hypothetical protein